MKSLFFIIFGFSTAFSVSIYEFFKKGSVTYYQINSSNIANYFKQNLKWPTNDNSLLFESCRKQYTHFGLSLTDQLTVVLFQIKLGLDETKIQNLEYYCLVNESIAKQVEKVKNKKFKLQSGRYYHFKWDILDGKLSVFSVEKSTPVPPTRDGRLPEGFSALPLYLLNLENGKKIYFLQGLNRTKAAAVHPLLDIKYPVLLNEENGGYEFVLIEANPQFFKTKTRLVFKDFNHTFGIIPDRIEWRGGPLAVMP